MRRSAGRCRSQGRDVGLWFWLVTAPASWATGLCVAKLTASMGAPFLAASGIAFTACILVAFFVQHLINNLVASRHRA
jgi:hypothetical protein